MNLGTEEVFQEIYDDIESRLTDLSINPYGATLNPNESESYSMPTIVMRQIGLNLDRETLSYDHQTFNFNIEVNVYASDSSVTNIDDSVSPVHRRTIANQLSDLMFDILFNDYHMKLDGRNPIPNIDPSIYRINLRFSGKFNENKIISR